jgi:hypothetical protein
MKKAYRVTVGDTRNLAVLNVGVSQIGSQTRDYAVEFNERLSDFDDSKLTIPDNRQATFQEELRKMKRHSSSLIPQNVADIKEFIEKKMKEAYGSDCSVDITEI